MQGVRKDDNVRIVRAVGLVDRETNVPHLEVLRRVLEELPIQIASGQFPCTSVTPFDRVGDVARVEIGDPLAGDQMIEVLDLLVHESELVDREAGATGDQSESIPAFDRILSSRSHRGNAARERSCKSNRND